MNNLHRISQLSRRLRLLFSLLLILLPLLEVLKWLFFNQIPVQFTHPPVALLQPLSPGIRVEALAISLIPLSVVLAACYQLLQIFSLYEQGNFFAREAIHRIRILGFLIPGWVAANLIYEPLITLCLSMANPPGYRSMSLSFDSQDLAALITGTLVILISWIMLEGKKLEEEQAHTI